jgi:hypothetical protein
MAIAYRPAREADLERSDWLVVVSIDDLTRRHGFGPMATSRAPITDSYKSFGSGLYAKVSRLFIAPSATRYSGRRKPHQYQRDDRRQRVQAVVCRSNVSPGQPRRMGSAQEG